MEEVTEDIFSKHLQNFSIFSPYDSNDSDNYKKMFKKIFREENKMSFNQQNADQHSLYLIPIRHLLNNRSNTKNCIESDLNKDSDIDTHIRKIFSHPLKLNKNESYFAIEDIEEMRSTRTCPSTRTKRLPEIHKRIFMIVNNKIRERKRKPDGIRKKIKVSFHKYLAKKLNTLLMLSTKKIKRKKYRFQVLSQQFITNVSLSFNENIMNLTIKEIYLLYSRNSENKRLIEKIECDFSEDSEIFKILTSTYEKTLENFFLGSDFNKTLINVKMKEKDSDYYEKYVFLAKTYIKYYTTGTL